MLERAVPFLQARDGGAQARHVHDNHLRSNDNLYDLCGPTAGQRVPATIKGI